MKNIDADEIIELLDMKPLPEETGYYAETYRAKGVIPKASLPGIYTGDRSYSTAIYYMLTEGMKSHLHKITSDEAWHFYSGDPLSLVQISPEGNLEEVILGHDLKEGQRPQHVVPAGYWFGAMAKTSDCGFSLIGATVAPGFEFDDFTLGDPAELIGKFPDCKDWIERLA